MAGKMPEMTDITIQSNELLIDKSPDGLLGKGGYGSVFKALYKGKNVAVKMLTEQGMLTRNQRHDLKKEAQKLRAVCDHPYILDLVGVVMEENNYSLVLEYMHFGTCCSFIKDFMVNIPLRIQFAQQIISAMAWLHSQKPPVKHLDLKADNVLINNYFIAKISDFGLSQWKTVTIGLSKTQSLGKGQTSQRCGTLSHIPPEVFMNINKKGEVEEDVYAFAVTMWEIFTGKVPFENCNNYDFISNAVVRNQRLDLGHLPQDCPRAIRDMIMLSWDQNPKFRPTFEDLERNIEPIYSAVRPQIPAEIHYIRAQIVHNYQGDPEHYAEYYECTEYLENGQASPDGDKVNGEMTVSPAFTLLNSGDSAQSAPVELVRKFPELSLTERDQQTLIPGSFSTQSSQPAVTPTPSPVQSQVKKMQEASRNLGPPHVPISETGLKEVNNPSARSQTEDEPAYLSGFVSVKDKLYTPGSKLQHPRGPIAQPVSTVLESEIGRQATEGDDEDTSLKRNAVNDFLQDLSQSNPDLLETLMKHPESLENVLSLVVSGASGFGNSRLGELSNPVATNQPQTRPPQSCAGEVNPELPTLTGSVSVDQLSGQRPDGKRQASAHSPSVQQTTVQQTAVQQTTEETGDTVRMFPAPEGRLGVTASGKGQQSSEKGAASNVPPYIAPAFKFPQQGASQQTVLSQNGVQPSQRQTLFGQPVGNQNIFQQPVRGQIIFGQPVTGQNTFQHKVRGQLLTQNQNPVRPVQPAVHGYQQAPNIAGTQQAMNNTIFGQPKRTELKQSQPYSGIQITAMAQEAVMQQEHVSQQAVLPQQRVTVQQTADGQFFQPVTQMPDSTQRQQPITNQQTYPAERQQPITNQQMYPAERQQPITNQQTNPAERQQPNINQQTTLPNVSAPHMRSPVETSERLRSDDSSLRQGQPKNSTGPVQNGTGQYDASVTRQPITVFHRHAGGGSTTIQMDPNNEFPPNLQIGNNNYMVVNGSSDKKKSQKKKKPKCKKSELPTSTAELSMDHIDLVSVEIGKDWKRLCRQLDMSEAEIEQLQFDYHISGLYEIMYQGIQRWIQRNGREANVKRIAYALWEVDRDDIALRLR